MCMYLLLFDKVPAETHQNHVQMPDGCNPTNYSGTQINFWGVAPGKHLIVHTVVCKI